MFITNRMAKLGMALSIVCRVASAGEQTLECKLYIAQSLDHISTYTVESANSTLENMRRGGLCVFADGSIADKQFVISTNVREDGSAGDSVGVSVYTKDVRLQNRE